MTYVGRSSSRRDGRAEALARGLGWFSIGLGAAEVLVPRQLSESLGLDYRKGLVQACGLRELASGIGILAGRDYRPWIWGRIAGDAIDMASLAPGLSRDNPRRPAVGLALGAVAAVTAVDLLCARELEQERTARRRSPPHDYSDRSGFPKPPDQMRGIAAQRGAKKPKRKAAEGQGGAG